MQPEYSCSRATMAICSGLTERQLQWLADEKILQPRMVNHRRPYTQILALTMMVIGELRRKGLTLHQVKPAVPGIKKAIASRKDRIEDLRLAIEESGRVHASVYAHTLLDAITNADAAVWGVDVGYLAARLPQIPKSEKPVENRGAAA